MEPCEHVLKLSNKMMSKIIKTVEVEVNKRLEDYLVTFIKYNYDNGPGQGEDGFVRPSDEEIQQHISAYVKMTPFSFEEKVVDKKRMGRPKKNEKETVVAAEEEIFGKITNVSGLKLEHPNEIAPIVDVKEATTPVKAAKGKKEKVVKEKVVKEKAPKKTKKGAEMEKLAEGAENEKVEKAPKEKKEKVVKEKKEKAAKVPKNQEEGAEGEKKRGRPKKGAVPAPAPEPAQVEEEEEEEVQQLVTVTSPVKSQSVKQSAQQSVILDDEVGMEEYLDFEDVEDAKSPKTEPQEHIVKFSDKQSGIDYFIDKQVSIENEDAEDGEQWYAVKDATNRQVVGRSNLIRMELFEEDDEDDEEDEEEDDEEEDGDDEDD